MALHSALETERRSRVEQLKQGGATFARNALETLLAARSDESVTRTAAHAVEWASALAYEHPGVSRETYLAHPFRVCAMYLEYAPQVVEDGVVTALIHNVLEVTSLTAADVESRFGAAVGRALVTLTIDRARQQDDEYLRGYYGAIADAPPFVGAVKVVDKLDNLYVLCLNSDAGVRERYLAEIDRYVVPLAKGALPAVAGRIEDLVADNRRIGHRPMDSLLGEA